jgi:hypothetical protein
MNVYQNIAYNKPNEANEICKKYGYYQVENIDELAYCLQKIVADEGENSFIEIMELHPDKDVILELFEKKSEPIIIEKPIMERSRDCSCMMNADGTSVVPQSSGAASQTNMFILVAAMIVSLSIISMKK